MALINVLNITVHNNPAGFLDPFQFEVTFDCTGTLGDDLEWRVIYVGSAESSEHDQELDNVLVGPVPEGTNRFVLNVSRPRLVRPAEATHLTGLVADGRS
jgi:histone chaperone ASF1